MTLELRIATLYTLCLLALSLVVTPGVGAQFVVPQTSKPAAQSPTDAKQATTKAAKKDIEISGQDHWKDTGLSVQPGDQIAVTSTGSVQYADTKPPKPAGPEGLPRGWKDLLRALPVNEVGRGALIGRIGEGEAAEPFFIGAKLQMDAGVAGRLFIGINQTANETSKGSFRVHVEITPAMTSVAATPRGEGKEVKEISGVNATLFDQIPRRVQDAEGTQGDMVNFLLVGSEERVQRVLQASGWVKVDRTKKDAVLQGALATLSKKSYVELPMSELELFGRPQDYGFAHAVPLQVVAQRHHFRIWKATFTVDGETAWVGAGTHDIGFDRDKRTGGITHKIDPKIDDERAFILESLLQTGQVSEYSYLTPTNPLTKARTAHGEEFYSDGRVLIVKLVAAGRDRSQMFAELFCSVLKQQPDASAWGTCSQYVETPAEGNLTLGPLPTKYRVLIVPGVMNSCAQSSPAFQEGQAYLQKTYGLISELLAVPNESSEENAKEIAAYLKGKFKRDTRKYIVIGYSKGGPDLQTMLALYPETKNMVAAFVTVAGAIGGSPIADTMPAQAERWLSAMKFGTCRGNLSAAFKSLRRDVRQDFLRLHPSVPVPSYSLAALSDKSNTSKMLMQTWELMSAFDTKQDGQLTKLDATLPGAVFLGAAIADHFAVALPLANTQDATIRSLVDHNHYPRAALLEAIVRFVTQDLDSQQTPASSAPK